MSELKLGKPFEEIIEMIATSNLNVKVLLEHYVKTISELKGVSEEKIKEELSTILIKVKEKEIQKLKNK